jgi:hypothetical protein
MNPSVALAALMNAFMFYGLALKDPQSPRTSLDRAHRLCWQLEHDIGMAIDRACWARQLDWPGNKPEGQ